MKLQNIPLLFALICASYFVSLSSALLCTKNNFWLLFCKPGDFQGKALQLHNEYRKKHQSPELKLDSDLNKKAKECAEYLAIRGNLKLTCPSSKGLGLNTYAQIFGKPSPTKVAEDATKRWYNEQSAYDYNNPRYSLKTGHFTAMVWKSSTKFGFGFARKGIFNVGVALYSPNPNKEGGYKDNVLRAGNA